MTSSSSSSSTFVKRPRVVWRDEEKLQIIDAFNLDIHQEQKAFVAKFNSMNEKQLNRKTFNQWLDPAYRTCLLARIYANEEDESEEMLPPPPTHYTGTDENNNNNEV